MHPEDLLNIQITKEFGVLYFLVKTRCYVTRYWVHSSTTRNS